VGDRSRGDRRRAFIHTAATRAPHFLSFLALRPAVTTLLPSLFDALLRFLRATWPENIPFVLLCFNHSCFLTFFVRLRSRHPEQEPRHSINFALAPPRRTWQDDCHGRVDAGSTGAWDHHWQGHLEGQSAVRRVCIHV
jgi:hypothetical protein